MHWMLCRINSHGLMYVINQLTSFLTMMERHCLFALSIQGVQWTIISAGYQHACGVAKNGSLFCWGDNSAGQVAGYGEFKWGFPANRGPFGWDPPKDYSEGWETINAGFFYNCGMLKNKTSLCWGQNSDNQANITDAFYHGYGYYQSDRPWSRMTVSVGWQTTTCALKGTNLVCWWVQAVWKMLCMRFGMWNVAVDLNFELADLNFCRA
jgi:hypothetical protein